MRPHSRHWRTKKQAGLKKNRPQAGRENLKKLPRNSPPVTLEITHIGGRGDGVGQAEYTLDYASKSYAVFVPETLPGEVVIAQPVAVNAQGIRASLTELQKASPERQEAPCPAFGKCGGCRLQHLSRKSYQSWKTGQLEKCLMDAGIEKVKWLPAFWGEEYSRRRATFSYRRTRDAAILGFLGRQTHFIEPVEGCVILHPQIKALLAPLESWAFAGLQKGDTGRLHINLLAEGADITLLPDDEIAADQQTVMASTAAKANMLSAIARLSLQQPNSSEAITLLAPKQARLSSFGVPVILPPAVFLQASAEGEEVMRSLIARKIADNSHVLDLFCGAGTLSAGLLPKGVHLHAIDIDGPAISAFENAAHQAGFGQQARFERRNLFVAPLLPAELKEIDSVILDPPRQGAEAQIEQLRHARISQIFMVSCNPRTLARDLASLMAEDLYVLESVMLVDQFVYSTHIEAVACLRLADGDNSPQDR